jgi:hypothetical protein
MFLWLLAVTLGISVVVSAILARVFDRPLHRILSRLVQEELAAAWHRYLIFAIYVVGIGGGVRLGAIKAYISPPPDPKQALILNSDRWTLEIFETVLGTLQSVAWMLLVFFLFALIAYVVVRGLETRKG